MINLHTKSGLALLSILIVFSTACSKDEDDTDDPSNGSNGGSGTAAVSISGDVSEDLGDYATWEITEDDLLRIRVGDRFTDNIVMNYSLGSSDIADFETGTYEAVSATGTGMGAETLAFQYNGESTNFPESGTVTITSVDGTTIEGEIDVTMSPAGGTGSSDVSGTFSAEPLE